MSIAGRQRLGVAVWVWWFWSAEPYRLQRQEKKDFLQETRMTRSFASLRLLALLTFLFVCAGAFAQSTVDGAIGGTVYDAQKAAVPNATVTVHNNGTNADQKVTTDAQGNYRALHLQPGNYTVSIEAAGFKKEVSQNVIVEVGRITNIEPQLTVGGSSETVSVTSEAPTVNTETPDFATNVNQT